MLRRSIALLIILISVQAIAQKPVDAEGHQWWQHAVFYEIYPRSFADSNNDGIGDLRGIDSKLDYLHWLGVSAIWISPMFPSPQVDFGYDVSNYENVDPAYGTLADMDQLLKNGQQKNVKVILDFVVNHTSDKHPWFIESASSKTNPKANWYIWHDGKAGGPPNSWTSTSRYADAKSASTPSMSKPILTVIARFLPSDRFAVQQRRVGGFALVAAAVFGRQRERRRSPDSSRRSAHLSKAAQVGRSRAPMAGKHEP